MPPFRPSPLLGAACVTCAAAGGQIRLEDWCPCSSVRGARSRCLDPAGGQEHPCPGGGQGPCCLPPAGAVPSARGAPPAPGGLRLTASGPRIGTLWQDLRPIEEAHGQRTSMRHGCPDWGWPRGLGQPGCTFLKTRSPSGSALPGVDPRSQPCCPKRGHRPLRCQRQRWRSHRRAAPRSRRCCWPMTHRWPSSIPAWRLAAAALLCARSPGPTSPVLSLAAA